MIKRKFVVILLVFLFIMTPLFSESIKLPEYEPYTVNEFPDWSLKLRRGESLFFGSLALTMPVTIIGYNVAVNTGIFSSSNSETTDLLYQFSIAASISLAITLGDYILGEIGN